MILGIFGVSAVVGFILFSTFEASEGAGELQIGEVVIWGTMDKRIVSEMIQNLKNTNKSFSAVTYVEKSKETYNQEILEALAIGDSPDLLLLSNDNIYGNINKILPIPHASLTQRDFINQYSDAFSIFLTNNGILAIPFAIDPMVMYYNKDILRSVGIVTPPEKWEDFFDMSKKITRLDSKENITRATIAFGESVNVTNFKEILVTLMMQQGNNIVSEGLDRYTSFPWDKDFASPVPGLLFFTEFSNQASSVYSWNRSLPDSKQFFLSGRLATYFGFASEVRNLRFKNANLNFDVAEMPTVTGEGNDLGNKTVYARTWGLAIPKSSEVNVAGAFHTAMALASKDSQIFLSEKLNLPPVRRDLLAERPEDAFMDIFYRKAIYSKSFINPDRVEVDKIFRFMIDSITGGRQQPLVAARIAFEEIDNLFRR